MTVVMKAINKSTLTAQISALDAMMAAAPTMTSTPKEMLEEEARRRESNQQYQQDETIPEPAEPRQHQGKNNDNLMI
ncbi:hypothetical protein INT45_000185 [Circinella minor]|uniref:Uncharacterized protein n=1 Tax=Circinella minor TaxID=1195481 RepID=A0A8H7S7D7_9FUNG|nr:hypothetical protein INT45_000185 [Circinella minor]